MDVGVHVGNEIALHVAKELFDLIHDISDGAFGDGDDVVEGSGELGGVGIESSTNSVGITQGQELGRWLGAVVSAVCDPRRPRKSVGAIPGVVLSPKVDEHLSLVVVGVGDGLGVKSPEGADDFFACEGAVGTGSASRVRISTAAVSSSANTLDTGNPVVPSSSIGIWRGGVEFDSSAIDVDPRCCNSRVGSRNEGGTGSGVLISSKSPGRIHHLLEVVNGHEIHVKRTQGLDRVRPLSDCCAVGIIGRVEYVHEIRERLSDVGRQVPKLLLNEVERFTDSSNLRRAKRRSGRGAERRVRGVSVLYRTV